MSNSPKGQVQTPSMQNYVGDPNTPTTHMTWTEEVTITPVKRNDSSVKEQRQQALNTAKERAKDDLRKILAERGLDFKSARKNEKLWKKVNASYKKRAKKYFQEITSSRQNNRSNVKNQISQTNPSWDSMREINLEHIHTALDIAGLIPGFGIVPDALNAGFYIIEGDWINAGISAAAMIPILGQGATATKQGIRVSKELIEREGKEGIARAFSAKTPVGSKSNPMHIYGSEIRAVNPPEVIDGRLYSGHSLDRIQGRGLTPRVVENTIQVGEKVPGKYPDTTAHYDKINNITVITNSTNGDVITVSHGRIKQ